MIVTIVTLRSCLVKQLFSLQNSKTTYSPLFKPVSTVFHFSHKLGRLCLNQLINKLIIGNNK